MKNKKKVERREDEDVTWQTDKHTERKQKKTKKKATAKQLTVCERILWRRISVIVIVASSWNWRKSLLLLLSEHCRCCQIIVISIDGRQSRVGSIAVVWRRWWWPMRCRCRYIKASIISCRCFVIISNVRYKFVTCHRFRQRRYRCTTINVRIVVVVIIQFFLFCHFFATTIINWIVIVLFYFINLSRLSNWTKKKRISIKERERENAPTLESVKPQKSKIAWQFFSFFFHEKRHRHALLLSFCVQTFELLRKREKKKSCQSKRQTIDFAVGFVFIIPFDICKQTKKYLPKKNVFFLFSLCPSLYNTMRATFCCVLTNLQHCCCVFVFVVWYFIHNKQTSYNTRRTTALTKQIENKNKKKTRLSQTKTKTLHVCLHKCCNNCTTTTTTLAVQFIFNKRRGGIVCTRAIHISNHDFIHQQQQQR